MAWRVSEKDLIKNHPQLAKRMGLIKEEPEKLIYVPIGDYEKREDRLKLQFYKAKNAGKVKITEKELFDTLAIFRKQFIEAKQNEIRRVEGGKRL